MTRNSGLGCASVLALVVGGVLAFMYGSVIWHWSVQFLWGNAFWLVPVALAVGLGFYAYEVGRPAFGFLSAFFAIAAVVGMIGVPYFRALQYLDTVEVETVEQTDISFRERAPYDVAVVMSDRNMGNSTGTATNYVKSLPAEGEHGMYSTSITRREMFSGYEGTQFVEIPLYGQAEPDKVQVCKWSEEANLRFNGAVPSNNLTRAIYHKTPASVKVEEEDAVAICEDGKPVLYAPLKKLSGFPFPIDVPAGVAIYDGETGELTIEENYEGNIPVYPASIAEKQRLSTHASEDWIDFYFTKREGWDDTSEDEGDPNGANRAEFNLASEDAKTTYKVTPLTPRGVSKNITAIGTVEANTVESGKLSTYHVSQYKDGEERSANSTVADTIVANNLDGYRADKLEVFEVVPSLDGTWRATIGRNQSINYRAVIEVNGDVTLYDAHGNVVSSDNAQTNPESDTLELGKSIDTMSTDELRDAMDMILDEISQRLESTEIE